jgi:hypothetical protein
MLTHLRLAEQRGSLRAPNSPVQDAALTILRMLSEADKAAQRLDMVKALLVQPMADLDRVRGQFPEFFDPFSAAVDPETGEVDPDAVDEEALDWSTPASPDEDDDISAWIAARESGSVSLADMDF